MSLIPFAPLATDTAASTAVERYESRCVRAFIGYVRKLPHPFTTWFAEFIRVARNQMVLAAITNLKHYLGLTPKLRNIHA